MTETLRAPSGGEKEKENCLICKWKYGSVLGSLKEGVAYLV